MPKLKTQIGIEFFAFLNFVQFERLKKNVLEQNRMQWRTRNHIKRDYIDVEWPHWAMTEIQTLTIFITTIDVTPQHNVVT